MLTSYTVSCPHPGCHWSGSLLPQTDTQVFLPARPTVPTIVFQCPHCEGQWRARVVGDDVVPVPIEEKASTWA
jgi:hypothetical protein